MFREVRLIVFKIVIRFLFFFFGWVRIMLMINLMWMLLVMWEVSFVVSKGWMRLLFVDLRRVLMRFVMRYFYFISILRSME